MHATHTPPISCRNNKITAFTVTNLPSSHSVYNQMTLMTSSLNDLRVRGQVHYRDNNQMMMMMMKMIVSHSLLTVLNCYIIQTLMRSLPFLILMHLCQLHHQL